ncbi:MAG: histidinol-phosphate transaminase [Spirochaetia bacterium]
METRNVQTSHFANPGVLGARKYVPGKSVKEAMAELGLKDVVKMASNENPFGSSPKAQAALAGLAGELHVYPDAMNEELRGRLSEKLDVPKDVLTIGNGADGVIYNLGMAVLDQGDETLIPRISYPIYESIIRVMRSTITYTGMEGLRIDLEDLARHISPKTKAVFLCNPNNPTGDAQPRDLLRAFLERLPATVLVVLDEAYIDFADPELRPDAAALIKGGMRNLFVLRTFSKLYGLAGARVGYGIGDPSVIELIHRIKPPFGVSAVAERLALAALEDTQFARKTLEECAREKRFFYEELARLGLDFVPSHTNFVLVDSKRDCLEVFQRLMARGLLVRPAKQYGLPTSVRITVGQHRENVRLFQELPKVLDELPVQGA